MKWPKVTIATGEGTQDGIAPSVVSASRATDIPAFGAEWVMERFREGYTVWTNPFNGRRQYVSGNCPHQCAYCYANRPPTMRVGQAANPPRGGL